MESTAPQSPAGLRTTPTWLLNQTASHATRLLSEGFAAHDLRGYHYRLLTALAEDGPASQADLARRCGIDRSDVVAAINDLAGRGLVIRAPTRPIAAATSSAAPTPAPTRPAGWATPSTASNATCSPRCPPPNARN
ncbi:helix-turn-helix domain-containing protein [Micromonospora sp. M12]